MVKKVAALGYAKSAAVASIRMRVGVFAALSVLAAASTPSANAAPAVDLFTGARAVGRRARARFRRALPRSAQLQVRGHTVDARWRNESGNCTVPPLSVIFDAGDTGDTLFSGQTMLPLTTHCRDTPSAYEQYVLKEHLAYGIYNELTDKSLRTRLARVTYRDTGRRDRAVIRDVLHWVD